MDILERVNQLKERLEHLDGPPGWHEKYVVNPGETPWREIDNKRERRSVHTRQWLRMKNKKCPGFNTEKSREYNRNNPGYFDKKRDEWRKQHPERARELAKEGARRYRKNHPERFAESQKRFQENHPEYHNEWMREFNGTPAGRAHIAKGAAARRERSNDPALYAARVYILHDLRESCAVCSEPYDITQQIDHILALENGGTDDWDNYQPICIICHRPKTAEDHRIHREMLRDIRIENSYLTTVTSSQ